MEWTISQLAEQAQVTQDTIRYYEREGLLQPVGRNNSNYRIYNETSIRRIRFIKEAQSYGFNLNEVRKLLQLIGSDSTFLSVTNYINKKLEDIDDEISLLTNKKEKLEQLKRSSENCEDDMCTFLAYLNSR